MSLTLSDIRTRAKRLLQDTNDNNRRWPDAELNDYIFDAQHEFIRLTGFPLYTATVDLSGLTPEYARPTTLMTLMRARIRNRAVEIPIISPTVLDENIEFLNEQVNSDWRSQTGPIRAIVVDHQSASTFRLFPIPSGTMYSEVSATLTSGSSDIIVGGGYTLTAGMVVSGTGILPGTYVSNVNGTTLSLTNSATVSGTQTLTFVSTNIFSPQLLQVPTTDINEISGTDLTYDSSGVFLGTIVTLPSIELQGVRQPPRNALQNSANVADGSDVPLIGLPYHEALVYGCIERAYLKENELRNVQKSEEFRRRFLEYVVDARRSEPENRIRRVGGANRVRMRLARRWI